MATRALPVYDRGRSRQAPRDSRRPRCTRQRRCHLVPPACAGFEASSLEEIAEAAGFTRGAIYNNFSNKEQLFEAVWDRLNSDTIDEFRSPIATTSLAGLDTAELADVWKRMIGSDKGLASFTVEYFVYCSRREEPRQALMARWVGVREQISAFIGEALESMGVTLTVPMDQFTDVLAHASRGIQMATLVNLAAEELFEPFIDLIIRALATMIAEAAQD